MVIKIDFNYSFKYLNKPARHFFRNYELENEGLKRVLSTKFPKIRLNEAIEQGCITGETHLENNENVSVPLSYLLLSHSNEYEGEMFTLILRDNTSKKAIESSFSQKRDELNRFIYRVSHDLRGPIASMMGLSNLVHREINETKSLDYFSLFQSQVERLNNIVIALGKHSVLEFSDYEQEEFTFNNIVADMLASYQDLNSKVVKINKSIIKNTFIGNQFALQTILHSLIDNSCNFLSEHRPGLISIEVYDNTEFIFITIEDNGIGIENIYKQNIFQMFYKASTKSRGSGLGLYLFDTAVKKMGGSYLMESEVDKGTRFEVIIPIDQSHLFRK